MSKPNQNVSPEPQPDLMTRQAFVRVALGGVGLCYAAAIGYPVYRFIASPVERAEGASVVAAITLKDAPKLPKGSALMFKFGPKPALLIHHLDDSWVALDAVCTHLGCTVEYEADKNRIHCACHGGVYDANTGGNVSGPPPKPLRKYGVRLTDEGVIVSLDQAPAKGPEQILKGAASTPAGSAIAFEVDSRHSLLIHHVDNTWSAYDAICTHKGCKVRFEGGEKNRIFCPCHGGVFDCKSGEVVGGPPPLPLRKYAVRVENEDVVVSNT
jgi:cytochrome b6-f complex iron-sulfur subunit